MIIGIDPSINSTGVCVYDDEHKINAYYIIPSKVTKKMQLFNNDHVKLLPYDKQDTKGGNYTLKEQHKFDNLYSICKKVGWILDTFRPSIVRMEGVSYGSVGSAALIDLAMLNGMLRLEIGRRGIPFEIVSPTELKKFACANGQAEKDVMVDAWKRLDPCISAIKDIKVDDLADSYFLAHYSPL
jgi:Holliday junction resolvasome RuvABC endonuclease subunit